MKNRRKKNSRPLLEPKATQTSRSSLAVLIAAIVVVVVLAYLPAMKGGILWDDNAHITKPEMRPIAGLYQIWFNPGTTQQYYPLLYSAFWIEHKLWGDSTVGYHVINLILHIGVTILVYLNLRKLEIPGSLLAAAIFALHPVHVESVAWISEQKNTLSALFYLSAMFAYLRFDETRKRRFYAIALGLFCLGLLTKTVTATLPGALLVIFWWKRGRLSWRQDIVPMLPFFALGAIAGLFTAWFESKIVGAEGVEFEMSVVQRGLLSGRVISFYVSKLVWPTHLIFFYPRWQIDVSVWWQWLFPIVVLIVLTVAFVMRRRWRGPLAACLFFVGTLFPVLGFLNVYPFIYSFVADHFQYLASIGMIVLASSAVAIGVQKVPPRSQWVAKAICVGVVATLATLTWVQSRMYGDVVTLYRKTLEQNPASWVAANNLGNELAAMGQYQEAMDCYERALRAWPDYPEAHNGLAVQLVRAGKLADAAEHYQKALRSSANFYEAHNNVGNLLLKLDRLPDAIEHYRESLRLNPHYALAHNGLGNALRISGLTDEAIAEFKRAIELQPDFAKAEMNWGITLSTAGKTDEGLQHLDKAVRLEPDYPEGLYNLANALVAAGRSKESLPYFERAVLVKPDYARAHLDFGNALARDKRFEEAITHYRRAVQLNPENHNIYVNIILSFATLNRSAEAIETAQQALELARSSGETTLVGQLETWLNEYRPSHSDGANPVH
jgi:protein O-mannosyl-transferase